MGSSTTSYLSSSVSLGLWRRCSLPPGSASMSGAISRTAIMPTCERLTAKSGSAVLGLARMSQPSLMPRIRPDAMRPSVSSVSCGLKMSTSLPTRNCKAFMGWRSITFALRSPNMRLKGQVAAPDVRGIVAHGRSLLGRAVRAAWQARLLSRDPDGLFAGVLGPNDVDALLAQLDEPTPELERPPHAPLGAPRLAQLLESIGAGPIAADIVASAL